MKERVYKIYHKVGIKSERTKNITKHVLLSFFYKGGSILASFLLVPLTINYLDTENYGVWLTLSSFIAWFSFFDVGLGNGLRNKFAEAKAKNDITLAKAYVSSAYYTIGVVSLGLMVLFWIANYFIDWAKVFNTSPQLQKDLALLMPIVFGFFCFQLVVRLITTIYTADQQHSMQGKINFYTQMGSLALVWVMTQTMESTLFLFGTLYSTLPVVILVALNYIAFNKRYKAYKPAFKLWKTRYLKDIFGLGAKFFILQVSVTVLYSTNIFVITQLFGPKEVVPYNIAYKLFSISSMIQAILIAPYWSSFTEAYINKDLKWIKQSMKTLMKISFSMMLVLFLMVYISPFVYQVWIGPSISIPFNLNLLFAIYFSILIFYAPYNMFINGVGKIYLHTLVFIVSAVCCIPISIFFAKFLNFGVQGVLLGTIVSALPSAVLFPIQYRKILMGNAGKIWNK